jgi:hypothetical protein
MRAHFLRNFLRIRLALALLSVCIAGVGTAAAEDKTVNVSGKWEISWEARIGTERDMIELQQSGSVLTGTFHGKLVTPRISGNVGGKNITLRLDFPGQKPYSIVFTGAIDGEKMSGKFEVPGVPGAYDFHGENISPSNYTWSAVRAADGSQASKSGAGFTKSN